MPKKLIFWVTSATCCKRAENRLKNICKLLPTDVLFEKKRVSVINKPPTNKIPCVTFLWDNVLVYVLVGEDVSIEKILSSLKKIEE